MATAGEPECRYLGPSPADDGHVIMIDGQPYLFYLLGNRGFRLAYPKPIGNQQTEIVTYDLPRSGTSCECKGFLRWGNCKHRRAIRWWCEQVTNIEEEAKMGDD